MFRILHITPTYYPNVGGIESVVRNLVAHTRCAGFQADVLHAAPEIKRADVEQIDGAMVFRCPLRPHRLLGSIAGLSDIASRYDLLHVHDPQLMAISYNALSCSRPHRRVLSTHGGYFHTGKFSGLKRIHWDYVAPRILRRYDLVLASSASDEHEFSQRASNVRLVPNGVDVQKFLGVRPDLSKGLTRWLFWGRLSRNKRLDLAIDLVARVRRAGVDVTFTIAGADFDSISGELRNKVRDLDLERYVSFVGPLQDDKLLTLIADHSLFVTASEHEGFGLSIIEAMASGLVVICRDITPMNHFVRPGHNGLLLDFNGSDNDIKTLLEFCVKERDHVQMSANAREAALGHDWSAATKPFFDIYDELCGLSSPSGETK